MLIPLIALCALIATQIIRVQKSKRIKNQLKLYDVGADEHAKVEKVYKNQLLVLTVLIAIAVVLGIILTVITKDIS